MSSLLTNLQKCSAFLSKQASWVVIAAACIALAVPGLFAWVQQNGHSSVILGLIMLTMGCTLSGQDFKILLSRPVDILIGSIAQFTIMPLIAWSLSHIFGLNPYLTAGIVLVGCCPGGVSSNIMSFLCKGDVAFSVGMTTASTLLAPFVTPLLVLWLAGESIDVDAAAMFRSILWVTLMPVTVGAVANWLFGHRKGYQEMCKVMPGCSVIGLACIVGGVVSAQGAHFFHSGLLIFLTIFLHNTLGYLLGYSVGVFSRMSAPKCRTISIEVGMQNAGLATVLAGKHFPLLPEAAVASAICCAWHSITGTLLAGLFNYLMNKGILRR